MRLTCFQGAHIYFCGLKGMMPGITDMLERVAKSKVSRLLGCLSCSRMSFCVCPL